MQKEPTIKDHLDNISRLPLNVPYKNVASTTYFINLKQAIKQLRKENKRLKKEVGELTYTIDTIEFLKDILPPEKLEQIRIITRDQIKQTVSELPFAEFKCAKTNNPSNKGAYGVICKNTDGSFFFSYKVWFSGGFFTDHEVIAFTETPPEQILKALK